MSLFVLSPETENRDEVEATLKFFKNTVHNNYTDLVSLMVLV
jgi:hypothetical protein